MHCHYREQRVLLHHRRCGCHCSVTTPPTLAKTRQGYSNSKKLQMCIEHINSPTPMSTSLSEVFNKSEFSLLREFFERMSSSPARAAPVEQMFQRRCNKIYPYLWCIFLWSADIRSWRRVNGSRARQHHRSVLGH